MNLTTKIKDSIAQIQKAESIALSYNNFGFHLAFSGGKDSQVIHELCKMAGVKFKSFFYKTSIDPPELLKFIRDNYKDVEWIKPKETMFQLIYRKGMLPMRQARFCCEVIKERNGLDAVVITGIRKAESTRRQKRQSFESWCKLGKDKNLLNPILEWTDSEVYQFLNDRGIKLCSLYKEFHRLGCVGCPMNPKTQRLELRKYPNVKRAYINTVDKLMKERGKYPNFETAEDVIEWWCSGISVKEYMANKKQLRLNL